MLDIRPHITNDDIRVSIIHTLFELEKLFKLPCSQFASMRNEVSLRVILGSTFFYSSVYGYERKSGELIFGYLSAKFGGSDLWTYSRNLSCAILLLVPSI